MSIVRMVVRAALCAGIFTLAVLGFGVARKVQIDARAELARGEGLVALAHASGSRDDWVAAGEAFVAAMSSYVPYDAAPRRAASRLLAVVDELDAQGRRSDAARLVVAGLQRIDADTWLFVPLADVRVDFHGRLEQVAPSPRG